MTLGTSIFHRCLAATLLLAAIQAPSQTLDDPANLAGERVSPPALADTLTLNHGAPALQQLLLKLRTRASLMMIVAHPDDEDGGLLTYTSRGQGARVATLTLTRGEGGQNLMSADFDDALGLIRTQELLAADRYFGVDQFFGTEVDFGFSKTREETFGKWTHERVLYDAVRAVRFYRPLVLASVFVGGVTDGHGHHQVAGEISQEVFTAAADPKVFPDMIREGLLPWAPLKVYARVPFSRVTSQGMYDYATGRYAPPRFHNYVTGRDITHEPAPTVLIHEGEPATVAAQPALGMEGLSYVQFARRGLALQKTQIGAGVRLAPAGPYDVGYTLMASRTHCTSRNLGAPCLDPETWASKTSPATNPPTEQSLFDSIDTTLPALAALAPAVPYLRETLTSIDAHIAEAQHLFNPDRLELTAPPLSEALRTLDSLLTTTEATPLDPSQKFDLLHELRIKRVQLNNALVVALGLTFEASLTQSADQPDVLTTQTSLAIDRRLTNAGKQPVAILGTEPSPPNPSARPVSASPVETVVAGTSNLSRRRHDLPRSQSATRTYFSRNSIQQPFYMLRNSQFRNAPAGPAPFIESLYVSFRGVQLELSAIVRSPARSATLPRAAVIVPPISVASAPSIGILPLTGTALQVTTTIRTDAAHIDQITHLEHPPTWRVEPPQTSFSLRNPGDDQTSLITVTPGHLTAKGDFLLTAVAISDHVEYREGYRTVGYPGLTYTNFYTPATTRVAAVDVHTAPNLHIAYLPGTGDPLPASLSNLGITPTLLTLADLTPAHLKQFDAVLLGVRAYNAQPKLAGAPSAALIDYARDGGVVITQYNTGNFPANSLPYPLQIPGDPGHNVVVEAQPVRLLAPDSPVLSWPNKITVDDFHDWVEERGHGFAASFDPHFQPLLETHDPDQDPQRGGLLLAPVGRGAYLYCAFALYRQLPEGVPGAYRLIANLLSLGRNPAFKR